jgi:MFS family permease
VRSRPPEGRTVDFAAASDALPGLDMGSALLTRSFWMICIVNFMYGCAAAGMNLHIIHHLTNLGYTSGYAARMFGLILVCASIGKLGMGIISDRISARVALSINFILAAIGTALIFGAASKAVLTVFVVLFGLSVGAPLVLIPLLTADAMGLKRFGSIGGFSGIFNTIGAFAGPLGAGIIFDRYGGYDAAFEIFIALSVLGALAALGCLTLEAEQARLAPVQAATA